MHDVAGGKIRGLEAQHKVPGTTQLLRCAQCTMSAWGAFLPASSMSAPGNCLKLGACRLQFPPLGACQKEAGSAADGMVAGELSRLVSLGQCLSPALLTPATFAEFAGALYKLYMMEKDASLRKSAEFTALQDEV